MFMQISLRLILLLYLFSGYNNSIFCALLTKTTESDQKALCAFKTVTIQSGRGVFTKDDLKEIPFGSKKCEDYEEEYLLINKTTAFPIGIISFTIDIDDECAVLEKLGVNENFQKKGYGTVLLNHALTILKSRDIKKVALIPKPGSELFYRNKHGFSIGAMGYLEKNLK